MTGGTSLRMRRTEQYTEWMVVGECGRLASAVNGIFCAMAYLNVVYARFLAAVRNLSVDRRDVV